MEELLALLAGAGALALSPLLIPGIRPVAKSAVKGGMAVADAAKGAAAATGEQLHQLTQGLTRGGHGQATAEGAAPAAVEPQPAPGAAQPAPPAGPERSAARPPVDLRPLVQAAIMSGQSLAGAAAGALAGVNKQWTGIVTDAKSELEAGAQAKTAQAIPIADVDAAPVAGQPVAETPAAEAPAQTPAAEATAEAPVAEAPAEAPAAEPKRPRQRRQAPAEAPAAQASAEAPAAQAPVEATAEAPAAQTPAGAPVAEAGAPAGDDLRQVRGIGPKAAELLQAAGITTLEQLAGMEPDQLRDIVAQAGPRYRMIHPSGWPEEARQILAQRGSG